MSADTRRAGRTYDVAVTRHIEASAGRVYAVFADYREAHPKILPPRFFAGLEVEAGGSGAGTRLIVRTKVAGRVRTMRGIVTEPAPGRRLVETYPDAQVETSFLVEPRPGENACSVTITTAFPRRRGPLGWVERRLVRGLIDRVYAEELDLLAAYVRRQA